MLPLADGEDAEGADAEGEYAEGNGAPAEGADAEGEGHGGTYVFQAVDSTGNSLLLYPDSSGPFHADLIGDIIISDYNVRGNSITEACGSGIRRCIWR